MRNTQSPRRELSRRRFSALALASAATAASGCTITRPDPDCPPPVTSVPLKIDMHCHLMNIWDVDPAAFINRRFLNTDEIGPIADFFTGNFIRLHSWPAYVTTNSPEREWRRLRGDLPEIQASYQEFCRYADEEQGGIFFSGLERRITGFTSDRARNAALMMQWFPSVDIFMPAMVDLYEGWFDNAEDMFHRAKFHETLNLATFGRFLPLVAYHPKRQMAESANPDPDFFTPLELVEKCITELGFVGVKVHPSSGFSPHRNKELGCPNTILQLQEKLTDAEADAYDRNMEALFALCKRLDVPILTHNGTGIAAHRSCMFRKDEPDWRDKPERWTNSPQAWFEAMQAADAANPNLPRLRVCLAHMAGGFLDLKDRDDKPPHPWLEIAADKVLQNDQLYVDLSALSEMITNDGKIHSKYKAAFNAFFGGRDVLRQRLMYGSDLHMPGPSLKGRDYIDAVESLITVPAERRNVMGETAVDFFGLRQGRQTRTRLEAFYRRNGIDPGQVGWMQVI